jgi:hypothetical protein
MALFKKGEEQRVAGSNELCLRLAGDQALGRALDLAADAIVPVALPPGRSSIIWTPSGPGSRFELDEAKLVQLDRLRVGRQGLQLRELADQLGHAGRIIVKGIIKA